ncbi:MAG: trigger factor [Armatimonadota bacterium]|nr:trigger factor [Armatimonadota bacterium]
MALKAKEQLEPCKVELNIEVEAGQVAEAINDAYRHLAKRVSIPGFRKGKAPRAILERYIDEGEVKDEAARSLIPPAYAQAITEAEIDPYDFPDVEVVQMEAEQPFVFKATVPLAPKVELGEYTGLTIERMAHVVSDEDVERQINDVRERAAKLEDVTGRPVQKDDVVAVEMQRVDELAEDSKPFTQTVQAGANLPEFDEKLIGMSIDEEGVIDIGYPEDFEDTELAGKTIQIKTKVLGIKERKIPELTDELAKSLGKESVEELKATMRSGMEDAAANVANRQVESQLIWQIVEKSDIHFPEAMLEHEAQHRLQDLLQRLQEAKIDLTDYLKEMDKSFDQLQDELRSNAERDIKVNLAVFEVAAREKIAVTDEDVEAEIERLANERKVAKASMEAYLDRTEGKSRLSSQILRKKTLVFLVESSNIKDIAMKGDSE